MRLLPVLALLPLLTVGFATAALPGLPALPASVPVPPVVNAQLPHAAQFDHVTCPGPIASPSRALDVCNMRATSTNGPASEVSLAMDPADPAHDVVVAKGFALQRELDSGVLRGNVVTPYSTTFDGGLTWTEGFLQEAVPIATLPVLGPVGGSANYESDPVVVFAPDGSVLVETLRVNHGEGLPVYRSTDGGRTFTQISNAFPGSTDKNWLAVDRANGIVYSATAGCGGICVTRSLDNGFTWGPQVAACPGCNYAMLDVGPDGTVYAGGYNYGDDSIYVAHSADHGQTWSAPVKVARHDGNAWNPGNLRLYRTTNIAQMAVDKGDGPDRGSVYVVWAGHPPDSVAHLIPGCVPVPPTFTCATVPDFDVFISASRDRGATWSKPLRINDDATELATQFLAQVAVSPRGDVHVAWMDGRLDLTGTTGVMYYAHSKDGARSFEPNVLISDVPVALDLGHHQRITNLGFVGDYLGLQASDDRAVVAFPDTRYGEQDVDTATIV